MAMPGSQGGAAAAAGMGGFPSTGGDLIDGQQSHQTRGFHGPRTSSSVYELLP